MENRSRILDSSQVTELTAKSMTVSMFRALSFSDAGTDLRGVVPTGAPTRI